MSEGISLAMSQATSKNPDRKIFFLLSFSRAFFFFLVVVFTKQLFLVSLICAARSVNITPFRHHVRTGNSCYGQSQAAKLTVLSYLCYNL